jgi:hypothetical protein
LNLKNNQVYFISRFIHKLNNPLTSIKGALHLLKKEKVGRLTKQQEKLVDMIEKNNQNLIYLIGELDDLSKIESGNLILNKASFDILSLVRSVTNELLPFAEEKGIEVNLNLPPKYTEIFADTEKTKVAFSHILMNALKFTPKKGKIEVELKDLGDEVQISVRDNGIGIGVEDLDKVFKAFWQGGTVKSYLSGIGIGLYLAKGIVEAHGGRIWVESVLNRGSTFTFTLPKN